MDVMAVHDFLQVFRWDRMRGHRMLLEGLKHANSGSVFTQPVNQEGLAMRQSREIHE